MGYTETRGQTSPGQFSRRLCSDPTVHRPCPWLSPHISAPQTAKHYAQSPSQGHEGVNILKAIVCRFQIPDACLGVSPIPLQGLDPPSQRKGSPLTPHSPSTAFLGLWGREPRGARGSWSHSGNAAKSYKLHCCALGKSEGQAVQIFSWQSFQNNLL